MRKKQSVQAIRRGMEIADKWTVYGECIYRLVPWEDEPSLCLRHEWIYLPSA